MKTVNCEKIYGGKALKKRKQATERKTKLKKQATNKKGKY